MSSSGFVLLDKIAGETSFKALFPLKRVFCTKRVGHAGTLEDVAREEDEEKAKKAAEEKDA